MSVSTSQPRAARVLVVEDEPSTAKLLELFLKKQGYDVLVAGDGGQALAAAAAFLPDAVLLDLHLPDLSGVEVLERLRAEPAHAPAAVVILSANRPEEAPPGADLADAFCTKPVTPLGLTQTLRDLGVAPTVEEVG